MYVTRNYKNVDINLEDWQWCVAAAACTAPSRYNQSNETKAATATHTGYFREIITDGADALLYEKCPHLLG